MPTNVFGKQVRDLSYPLVHVLRKGVAWDDTGIGSGLSFENALPKGARILFAVPKIKTAFNGTTPVLVVGINSPSFNDIVAAGDVDVTLAKAAMVLTGADLEITADVFPFIKFTTGGSTTQGEADISIVYATA